MSTGADILPLVTEPSLDAAEIVDRSRLTSNYWVYISVLATIAIFDYFDFYVIGFLGSAIARQDHLRYWQLSSILIAAGAGAIVGALFWGNEGDQRGRKPTLVLGTLICGLSSACFLFVPARAWPILVALRFAIGFGLSGGSTAAMTLTVEFTPVRLRSVLSGLPVIGATAGTLLASTTVAGLITRLGWQGVAALGVLPALLGLVALLVIPESPLWLARVGRFESARATIARMQGIQKESVPNIRAPSPGNGRVNFTAVFHQPKKAILTASLWGGILSADYGVYLLGPTLVALSTGARAAAVAHIFMLVSAVGILGKISFSILPRLIKRRRLNEIGAIGAAVSLFGAALLYRATFGGFSVFVELLIIGAFFFDGIVANLAPYTVEIYPTELAARGYGLGQAANGVGKIAGPVAMAVIAGAAYVTPRASIASLTPTFLFLAACALSAAGMSILIPCDPIATHTRSAVNGSRDTKATPSNSIGGKRRSRQAWRRQKQ